MNLATYYFELFINNWFITIFSIIIFYRFLFVNKKQDDLILSQQINKIQILHETIENNKIKYREQIDDLYTQIKHIKHIKMLLKITNKKTQGSFHKIKDILDKVHYKQHTEGWYDINEIETIYDIIELPMKTMDEYED
jgi:hypothetical protein